MKYLFKVFFLLFLITELAYENIVSATPVSQDAPLSVILLLIILASNIYRIKFKNSLVLMFAEFLLISYAASGHWSFAFLYASLSYDLIGIRQYYSIIAPLAGGIYFLRDSRIFEFLLVYCICTLFSYITNNFESKENSFIKTYDTERKYRYELEQTKAKLLNSSKEIAYLAEVKERNRIAREIHDTIGHSIAGILIQLQAAFKLFDRDSAKSRDIIKNSIDQLASSVTLLRETVHNIKPNEKLGVEYIKNIVENFSFCPVDIKFNGDFNNIPPNHMEILGTNIKEALTNASKHSNATNINITIDCNEVYTRLYIKDNGKGCSKIKEGLGISGMKERIRNIGGTLSISSDNGFLIVAILPVNISGGAVFEGSNS